MPADGLVAPSRPPEHGIISLAHQYGVPENEVTQGFLNGVNAANIALGAHARDFQIDAAGNATVCAENFFNAPGPRLSLHDFLRQAIPEKLRIPLENWTPDFHHGVTAVIALRSNPAHMRVPSAVATQAPAL